MAKSNDDFLRWRKRMQLSQVKAAEALGLSAHCVFMYDTGKRYGFDKVVVVPKSIKLAAAAIEHGLQPIGSPGYKRLTTPQMDNN